MITICAMADPGQSSLESPIEQARLRTVKLYGLGAGPQTGYGSGILVSPEGLILTTSSLLIDARKIRVVTHEGALYVAEVASRDENRQMALLQITGSESGHLPSLPFFAGGSSSTLHPGDWVLATGNPFKVADGAEPVSATLSAFCGSTKLDARRRRQDFPFRGKVLVLDAVTSNPGAPGGPVVDLDGNWVGMVGRVVVSNLTHTQFNHAIPVETCLEYIDRAQHPLNDSPAVTEDMAKPAVTATSLGIKLFQMGYKKKLVFIERVRNGSVAAKAGLKADDLIVSVSGRNVPDLDGFKRLLQDSSAAPTLNIVILRNEKPLSISLDLESKP